LIFTILGLCAAEPSKAEKLNVNTVIFQQHTDKSRKILTHSTRIPFVESRELNVIDFQVIDFYLNTPLLRFLIFQDAKTPHLSVYTGPPKECGFNCC
jgi:hypothetical protein